jgi:hypothetical protein
VESSVSIIYIHDYFLTYREVKTICCCQISVDILYKVVSTFITQKIPMDMYTIDIHDLGIQNLADTFSVEHTELPIVLAQAALFYTFG